MKKLLLFDFDGTIADSFLIAIEEFNKIAPRLLARPIDLNELDRIRSMSILQLFKSQNINIVSIPIVIWLIQKQISKRIADLRQFGTILEIISQIKNEYPDLIIGILSANSTKNITAFLQKYDSESLFNFIYSTKIRLNKKYTMKQILKFYNLNPENVLYVCDENRDIEMTHSVGVRSLAVTWGYSSQTSLEKHNPNYLIDTPDKMTGIVDEFVQS